MKHVRYYSAESWGPLSDEVEVDYRGYITIPKKLKELIEGEEGLTLNCHGGWYVWPVLKRYTIKVPYEPYDHLSLTVAQRMCGNGLYIIVHKLGPYKA